MATKQQQRADLVPVPMLLHESLYVGIDVGKAKHVAGFVSTTFWSGISALKHAQRWC